MSVLDQLFVYHPDPWEDRDWAKWSGLPLEDVRSKPISKSQVFESTGPLHMILVCTYTLTENQGPLILSPAQFP